MWNSQPSPGVLTPSSHSRLPCQPCLPPFLLSSFSPAVSLAALFFYTLQDPVLGGPCLQSRCSPAGISGIQVMGQALPFLYYRLHRPSTPTPFPQSEALSLTLLGREAAREHHLPCLTPSSHFLQAAHAHVGGKKCPGTHQSHRVTTTPENLPDKGLGQWTEAQTTPDFSTPLVCQGFPPFLVLTQ